MSVDFRNLLNSSAFLNYPDFSKDIFKGMREPHVKFVLKTNYTLAESSLLNRIRYCYNCIIHKLYSNLSPHYCTHFERIKAESLNKKGHDLDYFLYSNAFLNLPEISNLVFTLMKQPDVKFSIPKNEIANESTLINRVSFIFSSLLHNLQLIFSSSYSTKFKLAATILSDAILVKINKQAEKINKKEKKKEKKQKVKEDQFIKTITEKYLEIDSKQKELENTETAIKTLNQQLEHLINKTSPQHLGIAEKNKRKSTLETLLREYDQTYKTSESEISTLKIDIKKTMDQLGGLKSDQSNAFLNAFKSVESKSQLDNTIITEEASLERKNRILEEQTIKQNTLHTSVKEIKKELKKIPKTLNKIEVEITEKLISTQLEVTEIQDRPSLLKNLIENLKKGLKKHLSDEANKALFESLIDNPEIEKVYDLIFSESTKEENSKDLLKKAASLKSLRPEIILEKAENAKTPKESLLEKFNQFNPQLNKLLEGFLGRFDEKNILSFAENHGNFSIKLQKPLKLWVSKTTEADPVGGSILIFGNQSLVEGRLNGKTIEFTNGFEVYCKSGWFMVTATVYSFSEKPCGLFDLTAGKAGLTKAETSKISDTILKWQDCKLAEVVDSDHVSFLKTKL